MPVTRRYLTGAAALLLLAAALFAAAAPQLAEASRAPEPSGGAPPPHAKPRSAGLPDTPTSAAAPSPGSLLAAARSNLLHGEAGPAGEVDRWAVHLASDGGSAAALTRFAVYRALIEEALQRHGLPLDLAFVPWVESEWTNEATSGAGAAGMWQFMPGTARAYGLEVSGYVDERRDPVRASDAAARHLADLYAETRDWHAALASYNAGVGRSHTRRVLEPPSEPSTRDAALRAAGARGRAGGARAGCLGSPPRAGGGAPVPGDVGRRRDLAGRRGGRRRCRAGTRARPEPAPGPWHDPARAPLAGARSGRRPARRAPRPGERPMSALHPAGRQDAAVRWLLERGGVAEADVRQAETARAADPGRPELLDHLIGAGAVAREQAHAALSAVFRGERVADLDRYLPVPAAVEALLAPDASRRMGALPLARSGNGVLEVAVCDPYDLAVLAELEGYLGAALQPQPVLCDAHALYARIAEVAARAEPEAELLVDVGDLTQRAATEAGGRAAGGNGALDRQVRESAVSQLTDRILQDAVRQGASDIHIEFFPGHGWVRLRIDGVLREWGRLPPELEQDLVGHIKARSSGMDSVNRLTPQDGRLTMATAGRGGTTRTVEFRVSSIPTVNGEKAVLRVVDQNTQSLHLADLGFAGQSLEILQRAMRQAWGMVLVTGPTGSGKSTTLYSMLTALARPEVNIISIEHPVERRIPMVTQVSIRPTDDRRTSVSYASVLPFLLRQDPNIMMLGEIRDQESAETATRVAMTGHLLLSTLHTNDAPSTVSRLLDMGVEPYNLAGTLRLVIAQRLPRRICAGCKAPHEPDPALLALAGVDPRRLGSMRFMRGQGCDACGGTGYRGRIGIFEMLEINDAIRRLIAQRRPDSEIAAAGLANHMLPLRQAGWARIREGQTTLEEILKET
jgi:type IV pilus assembly protein PilB